MNWYKNRKYKHASSLGVTLGKWLSQAQNGTVDMITVMDDIQRAIQDDGSIADSDQLNMAISEAHQFLLNNGQTDPYNTQQNAIIDSVKNIGSNPSNQSEVLNDNNQIV